MRGFAKQSKIRTHENKRAGKRPGDKMGTPGVQMRMWDPRWCGCHDTIGALARDGNAECGEIGAAFLVQTTFLLAHTSRVAL